MTCCNPLNYLTKFPKPKPMKHTFTLDAWYRHIKKQLRKQPALSLAEIKQPLRFDWALYGRILQAKHLTN
jgi:hypothetical protein